MDIVLEANVVYKSVEQADPLLSEIAKLSPERRDQLIAGLERGARTRNVLSHRQRVFAAEYIKDMNVRRAAQAAGYRGNGYSNLRDPDIAEFVDAVLKTLEEKCELDAEYVRNYIHSVLELCPTDFCAPGAKGRMCMNAEDFASMPHEVKRLIESAEYTDSGEVLVKFVSKSAAMALAARFTLTQKVDVAARTIPWKELINNKIEDAEFDVLENQIAAVSLTRPSASS